MKWFLLTIWAMPVLEAWDHLLRRITKKLEPDGSFTKDLWVQRSAGLCGGRTQDHPEHWCVVWLIRVPWVRYWELSYANFCMEREWGWHRLYVMHATGHGWSAHKVRQ